MKLYIVSNYPAKDDGVSEYTQELLDVLKQNNLNIISRKIFFYDQKRDMFLWFKFFFEVLIIKPDIVHVQYTPTICGPILPLFFMLLKFSRITTKLVLTTHEKTTAYSHHFNHFIKNLFILYEKMIFNFCDKIIVHTEEHKEELSRYTKTRLNKIEIIPHPITERHEINPIQKEKVIKKYNLNNKTIIAYFGFIRPNKGMEYLINAFPKVLEKKGNLILLIAGIEPKEWRGYLNKLEELVKINGVGKYVRITGYMPEDEIPVIFSLSEIIVMPLLIHTTNSRALHRAISYNKPVIITDLGSGTVSEIVKRYNIGCVVPPRDSRAIADAILGMLDNPEEMEMFRKNELKVAEELSQKNIAKMHIDLYADLINSGCEK